MCRMATPSCGWNPNRCWPLSIYSSLKTCQEIVRHREIESFGGYQ